MNQIFLNFDNFNWKGIDRIDYQSTDHENTITNDITIQKLINNGIDIPYNIMYFECCHGGFLKLEGQKKSHTVIIARGNGKIIVQDTIYRVKPFDLVVIPDNTAQQFLNIGEEPFGFFCIVNSSEENS